MTPEEELRSASAPLLAPQPGLAEILAAIDGERGYMDNWAGRARNHALSDARGSVEKLFETAAAARSVVAREALEALAAEWKQSADEDERYLNKAHASEIHDVYASIRINREHADAVLALLDGTAR